jgi:hypothetical protein
VIRLGTVSVVTTATVTGHHALERDDIARRRLALRLAIASVLGVAAAAVCYFMMVRTTLGQRFDNEAYLGARQQLPGVRAYDAADLRRITADSFAVVLVALVFLGALRRRFLLGWPRRWPPASRWSVPISSSWIFSRVRSWPLMCTRCRTPFPVATPPRRCRAPWR